jgi:hypothetical protein
LAEIEINDIKQEPLEEENQHAAFESDHDAGEKFKLKMEDIILKLYEELDNEKSENSTSDFRLRRCHLTRHVNIVHMNLRPFHCTFCGKHFCQNGNLKRHIRSDSSYQISNWTEK